MLFITDKSILYLKQSMVKEPLLGNVSGKHSRKMCVINVSPATVLDECTEPLCGNGWSEGSSVTCTGENALKIFELSKLLRQDVTMCASVTSVM